MEACQPALIPVGQPSEYSPFGLSLKHQLELRQYQTSLKLHPCMGNLYAFSLILLVVHGHNPFNLFNIIAQQKYLLLHLYVS